LDCPRFGVLYLDSRLSHHLKPKAPNSASQCPLLFPQLEAVIPAPARQLFWANSPSSFLQNFLPDSFLFLPQEIKQGDLSYLTQKQVQTLLHSDHSSSIPQHSFLQSPPNPPLIFPLALNTIFYTAGRVIFTIINQIISFSCLKPSSGSHLTENKTPTPYPGLLSLP
jgi:hypothetical protein